MTAVDFSKTFDVPKALETYVTLHIEEEKLRDKCKAVRAKITENFHKALLHCPNRDTPLYNVQIFKTLKQELKETIHKITLIFRRSLKELEYKDPAIDFHSLTTHLMDLLPESKAIGTIKRLSDNFDNRNKEQVNELRSALLLALNELKTKLIDFKLEQIATKLLTSDKSVSTDDWAKSYKELEDQIRTLSMEDYDLEELLFGSDTLMDSIGAVLTKNGGEIDFRYVCHTNDLGQKIYRSLAKKIKDELLIPERAEKPSIKGPTALTTGHFEKEFALKRDDFIKAVRFVVTGTTTGYVTTTQTGLLLTTLTDLIGLCRLNGKGFDKLAAIPKTFAKEKIKPCNLLSRDWFKFRGKMDLREEESLSKNISFMLKSFLSKDKSKEENEAIARLQKI